MVLKVMGLYEVSKAVNTDRKTKRNKPCKTLIKKSRRRGGTSKGTTLEGDQ